VQIFKGKVLHGFQPFCEGITVLRGFAQKSNHYLITSLFNASAIEMMKSFISTFVTHSSGSIDRPYIAPRINRGGSSKNKRYACKVRFRSLLQPISKTPKWAQKSSKSFSRLTT